MNEALLQSRICSAYERRGWKAIKLDPGTGSIPKGFPDLLILGPGARVIFMEVKDGKESKYRKMQRWWGKLLRLFQIDHRVVRTFEEGTEPLQRGAQ